MQSREISNFSLHTADVANGIDSDERFDAIAVTGSLPVLQQQFHNNLSIGGRLFVIVGELPIMEACLITRVDEHNWSRESLLETCIPPLLNAHSTQDFIL